MWPMVATEFIKTRLPSDVKQRASAVAERELLSESAWLKRLVVRELQVAEAGSAEVGRALASSVLAAGHKRPRANSGQCSRRVYVRLRIEDLQLLEARAAARGLRPATYVSVLTRAHLRRLAPLPKDELLALRRNIGELAAIGRNLNQIAKAANESGRLPGSVRDEFRAMLKVCEALRDNTKALLKANGRRLGSRRKSRY
jgi:hypothetical protein